MGGNAYAVAVSSPCSGTQLVSKVSPIQYLGDTGDFTYAILQRNTGETTWTLTIYDDTLGGCYPQKVFVQVDPDADEPAGVYHGLGPGGPDINLGEAGVSAYP